MKAPNRILIGLCAPVTISCLFLVSGCGGSASESPMPLEPKPHVDENGLEIAIDDDPAEVDEPPEEEIDSTQPESTPAQSPGVVAPGGY